jgi:hypothetical protein
MQSEITRLRRLRHNLKHQVARHEARLIGARAKLAAIEAELQALDPRLDLTPPERTPNPYFARKELGRLVLSVLRDAEKPLRRGELVVRVLAAKGAPIPPKGMLEFVHHRLPCILLGLKKRYIVERAGSNGWKLLK